MLQALVFYTESTDTEKLAQVLRDTKFIGDEYQANRYLVGDAFFNHLGFLGCSPHLKLSPNEGDSFCHIELIADTPWFLAGSNSRPPKCPHCDARVVNWQETRLKFEHATGCLSCGQKFKLETWQFGKNMMLAKAGFVVWDVFENEVVPTDRFMQTLIQFSQSDWHYGFYRE